MDKAGHKVYYRVQDGQGFVEVSLIVERHCGDNDPLPETMVFQTEGLFKSMDDAQALINYLESIQADIEYVTSVSQTA